MKKFSKLLLLTLCMVAAVLLFAACGSNVELSLKESAMPQTVFVLGEEIDLSGGVLVVREGEETYEVDMTAADVTVSGYDKTRLGEQTITLTYKKKTIDLTVNVVERMSAVDYTADYLVGDTLNTQAGRLKITRNDGSNFTVAFNSTKVSITGFDSSAVGEKTLTVSYAADGATYTTSIAVNIHAVEKVELTPPNKVTYNSHDAGVEVGGGYLTLIGKGGTLKREVPLTVDMIGDDFDLSAVNATNTPLTQTVTVHYDNKTYTYPIKITYTAVSDFNDHAKLVEALDWTGDEAPEISPEQGETAIRIMRLYLDMSPAEKTLISETDAMNVARTALEYAFGLWSEDILTFGDAFGVEEGSIVFYCVNEKAVEDAIDGLANTERPIYELADIIADIVAAYEGEIVYGDMYFDYYPVIEPEVYDVMVDIFTYMLELDELMDRVDEDWRDKGVSNFAEEIDAVFDFIVNGDYYQYDYTHIFYLTSMWRGADDAFDFLYTYYYDLEDVDSLIHLANVRLPKDLEGIFNYLLMAIEQIQAISNYQAFDTSQFFFAYHMAEKLSLELLEGDDEMQQILYYSLPLNGMLGISAEDDDQIYTFYNILTYLCTTEGGYYHYSGALLGLDTYHALMDQYMDILEKLYTIEGYGNTAAYGLAIEEMMRLYMSLTSAQQFNFIGTLNVYYAMSIPPYAFDASGEYEGFESLFARLLREYYQGKFATEDAKAVYVSLMVATEAFAQRYTNENWYEDFVAKLAAVRAAYEAMNAEDKAAFDTYLGYILEEYELIAERFETPSLPSDEIDFEGYEDAFAALKEALVATELSYQLIQAGYNYYGLFLSAFERVLAISDDIMASAPDSVKNIYLFEELYSNKEMESFFDPEWQDDDPDTTVYWSCEYMVCLYRAIYINILNTGIAGGGLYDYYFEYNMNTFLEMNYDLMWKFMLSPEGSCNFDKETVLTILDMFRQMSSDEQIVFLVYMEGIGEGMESVYLQAVEAFLAENYTADAASVASYMCSVEITYMIYDNLKDEESLEDLRTDLAGLKELYDGLEGEDKESFADFEEAYAYNISRFEQAIADAEAGDNTNTEDGVAA